MTNVIIDNEYATLQYHEQARIVHHTLHGFVPDSQLRHLMETGITLLQRYGATKWLANDLKNSAVPQETVRWINEDWFQRAIAAGWKHWAVVMPEKAIGRLSLSQWIGPYTSTGFSVRTFTGEDEALKWIERQ